MSVDIAKDRGTPFLFFSVFIAVLGGFLFGYFTGIISGALAFIASFFQLSIVDQALAVSIILVAALIGALVAGMLADGIGRKKTIFITSLLFVAGGVISTTSGSFDVFLVGRFVSGLGVGVVSVAVPMYLAEISPPHHRGTLVGSFQLAICFGILASYIVNYLLSDSANWRWMFAVGIFPSAIQTIGLLFVPESPAWLFKKGRKNQTADVLKRLRKDKQWHHQLSEMESSADFHQKGGWKAMFTFPLLSVVMIGFFLSIFQQVTGINTVFYYAPKIFETVGFGTAKGAIFATIILGIVNVIVTFVATRILDKVGRKILLLIGTLGMAICFGILSLAYYLQFSFLGGVAFGTLLGYIIFFAIGLGPVTWVVLSEIFPMRIRGKAMTFAIFGNWLLNYFVSLTFLTFIENLKPQGTFLLYALINVVALWFVARFIPETKGKTLEEIEHLLTKR